MTWIDRHLILSESDWGGLFANKKITASSYISIAIGFILLSINDGASALSGEKPELSIYTLIIFLTLSSLAAGVYFRKYYMIPLAIIIFNSSFIFVTLFESFAVNRPLLVITICQTVMYFIINAIVFRLFFVLILNLLVFCSVCICLWHTLELAEAAGSNSAQPFMLNAVVLSAACLLLLHMVLTVRAILIEQLGTTRLQVAALEAAIEIENARQEARERTLQLNRISVIEALGASIAHEINQPIAAALTYSQAARNWAAIECDGAPETLRAVAGVESNVGRAARLIDNIRLLTTKKDRAYALADVAEIVSDQVNLIQAEFDKRGIKILFEPSASNTRAVVCAPEVALATINLLRNAMEAFDSPEEGGVVFVDCRKAGPDWVEVQVTDNGKGLAPDALQAAFSAFQSTKETGAGIGLSICQEVAEHHAGSVSLTPNAERGMTATLRLATKPGSA